MSTELTKRQFALQLWRSQGGPFTVLWRTLSELVQRPFYPIYERMLMASAETWHRPQHIGIIMDGNRRFARQIGASNVAFGHQVGADKLREMLDWCFEREIPVVTVWGFSLDNFHRDTEEVQQLLELFERKTREMVTSPDLHDNEVRVRFIGRRDLLPESLQDAIREVELATGHYQRFVLNIALAYGGREEIADAFLEYLAHSQRNGKSLQEVISAFDSNSVEPYLYTSGLPEPDLIIRTSGEVRLSGFMLWQSANSEYYFCDTNWPAFRKIDFLRALRSYDARQRRFGR